MSACLSDDEVLAFLDRGSPRRVRPDADEHLEGCADCRALVAEAARGLFEPGEASTLQETRRYSGDRRLRPPPRPLEPGELVSRYRVIRPIGAGGAGVVYEAFDPQLGRRIALKMVRPDADEIGSGPTRLLREAQAMARLSHPNVVHVHDAGTYQGQVFAAMEYVDGRTVARWLEEARPGWRAIVQVFVDAGRGLEAAHAAHLIHRDFKPENVLVGSDGRARVTDFGLARASNLGEPEPAGPARTASSSASPLTLTGAGALAGTPAYMAPEQFQGARADERTDQFNFCAALYQALYGQRPFAVAPGEAMTVGALARQVVAGNLRPPPVSEVPEAVFAIVRRGLGRDRVDRYPSMSALREALVAALEPTTLAAARPRSRRGLAVAAALLLASAATLALRGSSRPRPPVAVEVGSLPRAPLEPPPAPMALAAAAVEPPHRRAHPARLRHPSPAPAPPAKRAPAEVVAPPEAGERLGFKLKDPFAPR